jgi:hypothetical protein
MESKSCHPARSSARNFSLHLRLRVLEDTNQGKPDGWFTQA